MVTGKPPRHSKSAVEPVTVDLDAKDVGPGMPSEDPQMAEGATAEDAATEAETQGSAMAEEPVADPPSQPVPPERPPEPEETQAAETSFATSTAEAQTGSAPVPARSTSSLVAAGIFGGLVALAGAGSLQYAGLLAPFSSARAPAADISGLTTDIDGLKQDIATLQAQPGTTDSVALENRIAALEAAANAPAAEGVSPAAIAELEQKLAAANTAIEQLKSEFAGNTEATESKISAIGNRLDEAEKKLEEPRNDVTVARAVALASLKAAVERGGPFLAELDTFASIAPEDPAIAGLQPFAAAGVPSRADLMRQFPDVASAMLSAIHQPDPDAGIAGRLMDSALSLVKVRPVGNVEGEGPDAVVARIEDKLKNGDLKGASLEWANLPPAAQAAASPFKTALDNRLNVEGLVDTAMSATTTATNNEG